MEPVFLCNQMFDLTYKIYTLGCKVNQYDSGELSVWLERFGWRQVNNDANLAVINTCAVTHSAITKDKRMINKARRDNPRAKLIVTGCWPEVYPDEAGKAGVAMIFGAGKPMFVARQIVNQLGGQEPISLQTISAQPGSYQEQIRYFIKIQDGCEQYCSYCIIPYSRGKPRSRNRNEIIKEAKKALAAGYKEIVLSGIHLGLYGREKNKTDSLSSLMAELAELSGEFRLRLSSIELNEVDDQIVKYIKDHPKICRHLHIPLQAGSPRVLKAMNRPYTDSDFEKRVYEIKEQIPDIALTTDIIVGFPGEGATDFQQTYKLAERIKFSRLHIFPFSAHERTPAAAMSGQVPGVETKKRAQCLRKLGAQLEEGYRALFHGQVLPVLVENSSRHGYRGKTEYYFDVYFQKQHLAGDTLHNKKICVGDFLDIRTS
jgi:threonylcarbamoyladenosine tRNA methylthiotransferase MtaB